MLYMVVAVLLPCFFLCFLASFASFSCYKGHWGRCPNLLHGSGSAESFRRCPDLNMLYIQVVGVCWVLSMGSSALPKWGATSWKLPVESWRRWQTPVRWQNSWKKEILVRGDLPLVGTCALWDAAGGDVQGSHRGDGRGAGGAARPPCP